MNIEESNKLIAEFMGLKVEGRLVIANESIKSNNERFLHHCSISMAKYHISWDWIMPVVDKIEDMDVVASVQIEQPTIYIWKSSEESTFEDICIDIYDRTKLEAVYKAVIEFIQWYNENKL